MTMRYYKNKLIADLSDRSGVFIQKKRRNRPGKERRFRIRNTFEKVKMKNEDFDTVENFRIVAYISMIPYGWGWASLRLTKANMEQASFSCRPGRWAPDNTRLPSVAFPQRLLQK